MLHRTLWKGWALCLALGIGADVLGAPTLVAAAVGRGAPAPIRPEEGAVGVGAGSLMAARLPVIKGPRPIGGQPAAYPIIKELQRISAMAGPLGGPSIPPHLAGWEIGPQVAELRAGEGTYALEHTFEDASSLFYYGDIQPEGAALSVWHGYPADVGGVSLAGALEGGDGPSTSLSFTEDREEGGVIALSGVSLWQDDWGTPASDGVAVLSRYRSYYTDTDYTYQSEDHALKAWLSILYDGGGHVSEDGLYTSYWGDLAYLSVEDVSFTCTSEGESLSEAGDTYMTLSDFEDSCGQTEAPYHVWEAYSHTEYVWDGTTPVGRYSTSGTISCTNEVGALMAYEFSQMEDTLQVTYVDTSTGEEVQTMACAWDPFADGASR